MNQINKSSTAGYGLHVQACIEIGGFVKRANTWYNLLFWK